MNEPALIRLATRVIVDSALRVASVALWTRAAHPIPCMIDLANDPARTTEAPVSAEVVTFGNRSSLEGTRPFLAVLPLATTVRVIGPAAARAEFPDVDYRSFALNTFVADVRSGGVAVLAHDPAEAPRKDENRLVMALSCRRAAFVAPNPAYRTVLAGFGGCDLLVETPADLARALDTIGPAQLAELAEAGCAHVWRTHAPAVISDRMAEVLTDALESR